MRADHADGLPAIGETGRYLGDRPRVNNPVAPDGFVDSGTEGMNVVPPPVENLVDHRRPPDFDGTGKDPIFELDTEDLPGVLAYRPCQPGGARLHRAGPQSVLRGVPASDTPNPHPVASAPPGREIMDGTLEQPKIDVAEGIADLAEPYERALSREERGCGPPVHGTAGDTVNCQVGPFLRAMQRSRSVLCTSLPDTN